MSRRFRTIILVVLLAFSTLNLTANSQKRPADPKDSAATSIPQTVIPDNWKKIDLSSFSFYAPSDLKDQKVSGIDSAVWEFRNRNLTLTIDYGMYSNSLKSDADRPNYHEELISIDGRKAKLATFQMNDASLSKSRDKNRKYIAAVYFPDLGGNDETGRTRLTFWTDCINPDTQESAKKMFLSIKFK